MAAPDPRRGHRRGGRVLFGLATAGFLLGITMAYQAVANAPAPPPQPSRWSWAQMTPTAMPVPSTTAPPAEPPPAWTRPSDSAADPATGEGPTAAPTGGPGGAPNGGAADGSADPGKPATPAPLGRSLPVRVTLPRLGIDAPVTPTGLDGQGGVAVPDEDHAREAVWFDGGATPGQVGPSVILAHVDSWKLPHGRAAFYELGAARPGDQVSVARADGTVADFQVDAVTVVDKNAFPTGAVYGPTDTPQLRLITCGGRYSEQGGYTGNIVVYAHYTGAGAG